MLQSYLQRAAKRSRRKQSTQNFRRRATADAINKFHPSQLGKDSTVVESITNSEFACTQHSSNGAPLNTSFHNRRNVLLSILHEKKFSQRKMDGLRVLRYNIYNISAFISPPKLFVGRFSFSACTDSRGNFHRHRAKRVNSIKIRFCGCKRC